MISLTEKEKKEIEDNFRTLKNYIFDGSYTLIDEWFNNFPDNRNRQVIENKIINETYLFSYRSYATDIESIKRQVTKRHCAILKNVSLDTQLKLCIEMRDEYSIEHINCLKINNSKKCLDLLENNGAFQYLINNLFDAEKFIEIELLKDILKKDILVSSFNNCIINYRNKLSYGSTTISLKEKINKPLNNIIFQYTDNKAQYLLKSNYELPTEKDILILKNYILEGMQEPIHQNRGNYLNEILDNLNKSIEIYLINKNYLDLSYINNQENEMKSKIRNKL